MNSTSMEMDFSMPVEDQPMAAAAPQAPRAGRRAAAGRRAVVQESADNWDQIDGGGRTSNNMAPTPPPQPRPESADTGPPPPPTNAFDFSMAPPKLAQEASDSSSRGPSASGAPPASRGGAGRPGSGPAPPANNAFDFDFKDGGDDKKFTGVSRRKAEQQHRTETEEKTRNVRKYEEREVREEVLEIPELEEEGREDLTNQVADAPKVRSNRVQDIAELEDDMQFRLPSSEDRDIDLTLLTSCLCSSEQVQEGDEHWEPEQLFTDVASELNQEKEKSEEKTSIENGEPIKEIGGGDPGSTTGAVMM